jgi:hypothetical protein
MTTESYPIEGVNFTSQQFSKVLRRQHQGVDTGMSLSLSSTSNDATISTGRCNFVGFELEVTTAHVLTLPAVTSATTYVIGVLYSPANEDLDPDGPLSIVSGVKGAVSVPSGGAFWPLWEVTRQPSQTLNLATVVSYRVFRYSLLYAANGVTDPDPAFAQGGQLLVRRDGIKVLDGGQWVAVESDTGEVTSGFAASVGWSNPGAAYRVRNGQATLHLRATRAGSTITSDTTSGAIADTPMLTVPAAARSSWLLTGRGTVTLPGGGTQGFDWRLSTGGVWSLVSANPAVGFANGSVMYATVTYPI